MRLRRPGRIGQLQRAPQRIHEEGARAVRVRPRQRLVDAKSRQEIRSRRAAARLLLDEVKAVVQEPSCRAVDRLGAPTARAIVRNARARSSCQSTELIPAIPRVRLAAIVREVPIQVVAEARRTPCCDPICSVVRGARK